MGDSDSKKRAFDDGEAECQHILKRIKTDGFVKEHYAVCREIQDELMNRTNEIIDKKVKDWLDRERQKYYYESIGAAVKRSENSSNWIHNAKIEYEPGICCMDGDCWYEGNSDRLKEWKIYYLPGYDEYKICDVCHGNNSDGDGFYKFLRRHVSKYDPDTCTIQGFDVAPYENETKEQQKERAKNDDEWDDDEVMDCSVCAKKGDYRLIGTTVCLCKSCFMDQTVRATIK